ncbi:hypothetical protein ARMGADRAFT_1039732 [Armillaria gallica]|uniref:Retrotransposon gag domain-containing protein n=1 Tax=Armillaria gallica TaxID=47427 RepID=A0A2H3CQV4_ARMGA|nr:hypothetical protein ARMGADRAFT_1039732 [Armillaria gallica]
MRHHPRNRAGTFGLNLTCGAAGRMLDQTLTLTTQLFSTGWVPPSIPSYRYSGTNPWETYIPPPSNYQTPPWSGTLYPPMREGTHEHFPGHVQNRYDPRNEIASPSPRRPGTVAPGLFESWKDQFPALATGQQRTPTPIPTMSPDPLSDEEDFQTPRPSPIQSPTQPIPSQTQTHTDQTTTPSTQGDKTTSGPSSRRSTEQSSALTEPLPGNSDEETSSDDLSGPTLGIPESAWTSTLQPKVATRSWENRPTSVWLHGYTPTKPDLFTRPMRGREFPTCIGPSGTWNLLNPLAAAGVKPILMEKPGKFSGKHDDIEWFLGDCTTYFEVFQQYFMDVPLRTIVLLTSLLEGNAQDWWEFGEEFRDAAIKETHEKKMGEIKMYGKTATKFFRDIEREAKLANRRDDMTAYRKKRTSSPDPYPRSQHQITIETRIHVAKLSHHDLLIIKY